ncbi:hypothetical protein FE257_000308 [Aspergillus nanangensis]|uniref:Uncharacterized protein n=1 Tax=Aspergillus nanangensis TaxID=2582783 RepID=A0AAD4CZJ0_ASPNN|nr:hypothetical protein FE257_000308 [Aspergillus nanangensis]
MTYDVDGWSSHACLNDMFLPTQEHNILSTDGVTPRTPSADPSSPDSLLPHQRPNDELPTTSATATATATAPPSSPIYATAQPESQPSLAAPTGTTIFTPPETSTTTSMAASSSSTSPPPPQPGARPEPTAPADPSSIPPPPPKAGEAPIPAQQQQPQYPVPTASVAATQPPQPGSYSYGGYSYPAATAPPELHQRYQQQVPNSTTAPYSSVYSAPGTGQLPVHYNNGSMGATDMNTGTHEEEGFYGSAKSWLQTAGNKLAEVEAEVWRRINDHHDK